MSDQLRSLVQPFGDIEPPLDLHNRITARERELAVPGVQRWQPPRVLMFAVVAAGVGIVLTALAIAAHSRSAEPAPANGPGLHKNSTGFGSPTCAKGDLAPDFEIRRPPARQHSGIFKAHSHQPVVTIIVRNTSERRCYGRPAFRLKIVDRLGKTVGAWDDQGNWFSGDYTPGASLTFSLPSVYSCDHPGPFSAVASVHGRIIRRHSLTRGEITCS